VSLRACCQHDSAQWRQGGGIGATCPTFHDECVLQPDCTDDEPHSLKGLRE
jgi:hypothetical protein